MANVLMVWEQGSGLGHMTSMRPIAEGLQAQGHQVWIALKDFSKANQVFKGTQFRFIASPNCTSRIRNHFLQAPTFAHILHNVGFGNFDTLNILVSAWRSVFEVLQPEIVVTDHSPVAMLAARVSGIKNITLGTGFSCPAACDSYPDWRPEQNNSKSQLLAEENYVLQNANKLLSQTEAPALQTLSDLYGQVESLLITYPELDPFSNRQNAEYLGILPSLRGNKPNWPDSGVPRVFAYLRPLPGIEKLLAMLTTQKLSAIVRMPGVPLTLQEKFPSLIWEEEFVDLSIAASKADFCIGHGTHMMTAKWLLAGKPVLMFPPYLEQRLTAQRIEEYGAGLISSLKRPKYIQKAIEELLLRPERFRVAAEKFQQRHSAKSPEIALDRAVKKITVILGDN